MTRARSRWPASATGTPTGPMRTSTASSCESCSAESSQPPSRSAARIGVRAGCAPGPDRPDARRGFDSAHGGRVAGELVPRGAAPDARYRHRHRPHAGCPPPVHGAASPSSSEPPRANRNASSATWAPSSRPSGRAWTRTTSAAGSGRSASRTHGRAPGNSLNRDAVSRYITNDIGVPCGGLPAKKRTSERPCHARAHGSAPIHRSSVLGAIPHL